MDLKLDTREQEVLAWALASTISDLGDEISHTEQYEFRQDLKARKIMLREILERLGGKAEPAS